MQASATCSEVRNSLGHREFLFDRTVERQRERTTLSQYAVRTTPELDEFEKHLKCVMEGIRKDQILVRFTHVDPAEPTREFSLVIDVSESTYKGPLCPALLCYNTHAVM